MDIKELRKSPAYRELRAYVERNVAVEQRPYQLGLLAKRVLARYDADQGYFDVHGDGIEDFCLTNAFNWAGTPEGHDWWWNIRDGKVVDNLNPCPINGVAKAKVAKVAPKKRVGWWVA